MSRYLEFESDGPDSDGVYRSEDQATWLAPMAPEVIEQARRQLVTVTFEHITDRFYSYQGLGGPKPLGDMVYLSSEQQNPLFTGTASFGLPVDRTKPPTGGSAGQE